MDRGTVAFWVNELCGVCVTQSGGKLAWLFNPYRVAKIPNAGGEHEHKLKLLNQSEVMQMAPMAQQFLYQVNLPAKMKELSAIYLNIIRLCFMQEWRQAINLCLDCVDIWVTGIRDGELPGWSSSGISSIIGFAISISENADALSHSTSIMTGGEEGDTSSCLQKILNGVRKHIGKFRGSENDSDQVGAYTILLSESIRLCLELKNPPMATAFLKTIPTQQGLSPKSQRGPAARFQFYYGNLMLQKEMYAEAIEPLKLAAVYCPSKSAELKRMIYACLVAARMRLGFLPSAVLIEEHKLSYYWPLVTAIKQGNLKLYDDTMTEHALQFYTDGTTLCLNKTRDICLLILCYKVFRYFARASDPNSPTNIIPIRAFNVAIQCAAGDREFDQEETMCVLAHLIQQGLLRGYIAWQQKMVVLSKKKPFPLLE